MRSFYDWLRGHPLVVDSMLALLVLGLGLSVFGVGLLSLPVKLAFIAAISVPVAVRRRYPVGAFAAVIVVGGLEVLLMPRPFGSDLAVIVLLYTLAAYRPRRISLAGLFVCIGGSVVAIAKWAPEHAIDSLYALGATAAVFAGPALLAWLLGDSMQWRRSYYRGLEERAARLERERDAQAQIATAAERARIARELHDIIAHNVSVMVVQADGASYALRSEPERTAQALTAISQTGRHALTEMRRLLGVLRSGDEQADLAPVPGLDELRELLEQARAAGMSVSLTLEGPVRPLTEGAELAAYRVVQESLTNTRKHGGLGAAAAVTMRYEPNGLLLQVTDDGLGALGPAAEGPGHGLTGMRERIEMYGGTVEAGPLSGGGFQVTAWLPDGAAPDDHPHDGAERPGRSRRALDGAA